MHWKLWCESKLKICPVRNAYLMSVWFFQSPQNKFGHHQTNVWWESFHHQSIFSPHQTIFSMIIYPSDNFKMTHFVIYKTFPPFILYSKCIFIFCVVQPTEHHNIFFGLCSITKSTQDSYDTVQTASFILYISTNLNPHV